jgi:hypothetical protein
MFGFIVTLILGAALLFAVPSAIPERFRSQSRWVDFSIRGLGVVMILFAVLGTSYVHVPVGKVGHLFRIYAGGGLTGGRIVAVNGENGPQAEVLPPGFHLRPLVNIFYDVDTDTYDEVAIEQNTVGVLSAKDGASLRAGQAFADPFPAETGYDMLDAETFLKNGGQRGPQVTVLTPGKYRLNRYLWDVNAKPAREVSVGFVGVIKSNVHSTVDFGTLKAPKPEKCDVIEHVRKDIQQLDAPIVPVGCIGVWQHSLQPGKYYFNPDAYAITEVDTRAQVWTYAGGYERSIISLTVDSEGEIVQKRTDEKIPVTEDFADKAVFVKVEGWDVPLELRVVAQVSPSKAACVVASVGSLQNVEDRVLTPSIRAIARDVVGGSFEVTEPEIGQDGKPVLDDKGNEKQLKRIRSTLVLDLINQRPLIEGEMEKRVRPEGEKACVDIREVRLGEPAIPPELLVAVRREQLAGQLQKAFKQEKVAQDERITSEKAKATANQQSSLVEAEIEVKKSEQIMLARENEGKGERKKLTEIAAGQREQQNVLGVDATVALRKYELLVDRGFAFIEKNPEVISTAITNAHKFVPERVFMLGEGGTSGLSGPAAILGDLLSGDKKTPVVTTAPPPTQVERVERAARDRDQQ